MNADQDRRNFLRGILAGAAGIGLLTAGMTVPALKPLGLFAPRLPGEGPQGVPVNKTAEAARVLESAADPGWQLRITGNVREELRITREELERMEQRTETLPIACVEGWSSSASWEGVRLSELVRAAGGNLERGVTVSSLEERSLYRESFVPPNHLQDPRTLLALRINGETLSLDHGYPVRLIAPGRPGVMQTKWLQEVNVA